MAQHRKTRTEQRIRQALTHILRTKGFDAMTVSDVAREAGINRGTFYAHYVDKYDLMDKQVEAVTDEITSILLEPGELPDDPHDLIPREAIVAALRYMQSNYDFVAAVTANGSDPRLQEQVKSTLGDIIERKAAEFPQLTLSYHGFPRDYGREILLSAVTSVIWLWIRKGCIEKPEQICDLIIANKDLAPTQLLD